MRIPLALSFASLTTLLLTTAAVAQPKPNTQAEPDRDPHALVSGDCARARAVGKTCVLDMGGETVEGNSVVPNGSISTIRVFGTHNSLIHVRRDFIPEIVKSAEDL